METMNLLDVTIRYFNVIVFVLCVFFGMIAFFASWIAWREIHRKNNIIRSLLAAYNIAEDALEKGRTPEGNLTLDPSIIETVFNSIQEILNAIYGEVTGKPIPSQEDRLHGSRKIAAKMHVDKPWRKKGVHKKTEQQRAVTTLVPPREDPDRPAYHP